MSHPVLASLALLAGLGVGATAWAQSQPTPAPASSASSVSGARHPVLRPGDRNCIRDTGSLIPARPGHCLQSVPGRSYDQQDIRNTGQNTLGPALQMLDPSVTVHGH